MASSGVHQPFTALSVRCEQSLAYPTPYSKAATDRNSTTMKKILLGIGTLAATLILPASALAATYQYVTVGGTMSTVVAGTPEQAILAPRDIAPTSGVMLVDAAVTAIPASAQVQVSGQ